MHRLFDEVSDAILEYIALIAERAVQRSRLSPCSLDISTGLAHCEALATFGKGVRDRRHLQADA